jgi:hypothetical protein
MSTLRGIGHCRRIEGEAALRIQLAAFRGQQLFELGAPLGEFFKALSMAFQRVLIGANATRRRSAAA